MWYSSASRPDCDGGLQLCIWATYLEVAFLAHDSSQLLLTFRGGEALIEGILYAVVRALNSSMRIRR